MAIYLFILLGTYMIPMTCQDMKKPSELLACMGESTGHQTILLTNDP